VAVILTPVFTHATLASAGISYHCVTSLFISLNREDAMDRRRWNKLIKMFAIVSLSVLYFNFAYFADSSDSCLQLPVHEQAACTVETTAAHGHTDALATVHQYVTNRMQQNSVCRHHAWLVNCTFIEWYPVCVPGKS